MFVNFTLMTKVQNHLKVKNRIIVDYRGEEKGPLVVVFGAMHGNEPAGVKALELMGKMLEVEPITNPDFTFKGNLLGLYGNLKAFNNKKRFINKDLNRQWTTSRISTLKQKPTTEHDSEEKEMFDILNIIEKRIEEYQPEKLIMLDLHTTSSTGGIFTICTDDQQSVDIAIELHAPVIMGLLHGLMGTTLHYFTSKNMGLPTVGVTFESGQHDDPLSINRAIAAITNCLRTTGCVKAEHIENQHDTLLIEYSKDLPKVATLIERHGIEKSDKFRMLPNYTNFQKVSKGEVIAVDKKGDIAVRENARILMPLYQKQGEDGFFLIKEVEKYT